MAAPAPEGNRLQARRLTLEEINLVIICGWNPLHCRTHPMLVGGDAATHGGEFLRELRAKAVRCTEEHHDARMEYKEGVMRQFVEGGYVELTGEHGDHGHELVAKNAQCMGDVKDILMEYSRRVAEKDSAQRRFGRHRFGHIAGQFGEVTEKRMKIYWRV